MKEFAEYVNKYIDTKVSTAELLKYWKEAKSAHLFSIFGNNLFLEKEITTSFSDEQILQMIERKNFIPFYTDLCNIIYSPEDFYLKPLNETTYSEYQSFNNPEISFRLNIGSYLLDKKTLIKNTWEKPATDFGFFKVYPGTKITRIFSKLAKHYNLKGWKQIIDVFSKANTYKKATGVLRLSIHPLDYLTISENTNNWTTCMSISEEGMYSGTLTEILNSPYVVVAYLQHPNNKTKIWRELYLVHPNIIINIKGYPTQNAELTKIVLKWLKELAEQANFSTYNNTLQSFTDEEASTDMYPILYTNAFYNDSGTCNQYAYINFSVPVADIQFNYSGYRTCLSCGKINSGQYSTTVETLVCDNCRKNFKFPKNSEEIREKPRFSEKRRKKNVWTF